MQRAWSEGRLLSVSRKALGLGMECWGHSLLWIMVSQHPRWPLLPTQFSFGLKEQAFISVASKPVLMPMKTLGEDAGYCSPGNPRTTFPRLDSGDCIGVTDRGLCLGLVPQADGGAQIEGYRKCVHL